MLSFFAELDRSEKLIFQKRGGLELRRSEQSFLCCLFMCANNQPFIIPIQETFPNAEGAIQVIQYPQQ